MIFYSFASNYTFTNRPCLPNRKSWYPLFLPPFPPISVTAQSLSLSLPLPSPNNVQSAIYSSSSSYFHPHSQQQQQELTLQQKPRSCLLNMCDVLVRRIWEQTHVSRISVLEKPSRFYLLGIVEQDSPGLFSVFLEGKGQQNITSGSEALFSPPPFSHISFSALGNKGVCVCALAEFFFPGPQFSSSPFFCLRLWALVKEL